MLTCIVICSTSVFPLHYCQTVDPVCSASQCNLTQGNQLFLCKEMIQRPFCLNCMIDFSLLQSLKQIRRLNVDQFYLICLIKIPSGILSLTRIPVMLPIWSLRLSRCWIFKVVYTLIPACKSSFTS